MRIQRCGVSFEDDRGTISDVLRGCPVDNVTLIETKAGHVRGHHYHRLALVYVLILSGTFRVFSREGGTLEVGLAQPGDLVVFPPLDLHALRAETDGSFLLMAAGARGEGLTVREVIPEAEQ